MGSYTVDLEQIAPAQHALVGPKAAALAELAQAGVDVPPGFCVTTDALDRARAGAGSTTRAAVPDGVAAEIAQALDRLGESTPVAVRSSAAAEDLPTASFAGQHDSFLNVIGLAAVLEAVGRCWASLASERAQAYRQDNEVLEGPVTMAVIVQRMVPARAAGVLFTADPVSGDRRVCSIEAVGGLGEQLVSGRADPERYTVRGGQITGAAEARRGERVLTDGQVVALARLGRRIEAVRGAPQDVEWCLADDRFQIVQSRPITTLFPVPETGDDRPHVYVSVGHQQMFTDALTPLGLSVWQLTTSRSMAEAGSRLFVDVAGPLASPSTRDAILRALGRSDPLIGDALRTILDRGDVIATVDDEDGAGAPPIAALAPATLLEPDPAIVTELVQRIRSSLEELEHALQGLSGVALLDAILADFERGREVLFAPGSLQVILNASETGRWLDERMEQWLGVAHATDALGQAVDGNVTAEMGLALLDVADVIRPHPQVVTCLERARDGSFLDGLDGLDGGRESRDAIEGFLHRYGMRCPGEIDIARPRWCERPETLLPMLLTDVRNFEAGAAARRRRQGRERAARVVADLLERLRALPDGESKAAETERMIARLRTFTGYREYPKYGMVCRYLLYKRALLAEADRLVAAGVLADPEDLFLLRLPEIRGLAETGRADQGLIARRREQLRTDCALVPPRVFTSDGEVIPGDYRRSDVPAGALIGLSVSAGTVEGRARVVLDVAGAELEPGDILVTRYTDPSWTPVFVAVAGLVTEVGGLMTHGAVIAREYGLPAVVGVPQATRLIEDGRRIRLHGADGYVELL